MGGKLILWLHSQRSQRSYDNLRNVAAASHSEQCNSVVLTISEEVNSWLLLSLLHPRYHGDKTYTECVYYMFNGIRSKTEQIEESD